MQSYQQFMRMMKKKERGGGAGVHGSSIAGGGKQGESKGDVKDELESRSAYHKVGNRISGV